MLTLTATGQTSVEASFAPPTRLHLTVGFSDTDTERAGELAELLEAALDFHERHTSDNCPVWGETALREPWPVHVPPPFLVAAFFVWWVGIPLLLVVTPMIYRATKTSAVQFVLEHAQDNKVFFDDLMRNKMLIVREHQ